MKDLIEKIKHLENVSQALEPDEINRNIYLDQVKDFGNGFINSLEKVKAFHQAAPTPNIFEITSKKKKLDEIIDIYNKEVSEKGINAASGAHLGYIPGGGIFTASLGDLMADISNEYAGMNFASPGGVGIENELINWMKGIFNYPKEAIGNLTSGGSIANLIALTSARDAHQIKGDKIKNSVIYLSDQTHHCIHKALRIIGLEDVIMRKIGLDSFSRMNYSELKKQIESDITLGLHPFMIIASAGTTDTGAIDPLEEIGKIAAIHDLWYHIDAAYGGFFILSDLKKERFKGIERSDSLVVDPHKGLFLPYGIGAVLVKHRQAVFHSHHQTAHYMQDALLEDSPINPADVSPELTKHFRGMRMWLPLQLHGLSPFIACLRENSPDSLYQEPSF
jgi:glutamate/tyrosine decarboxylase-like PLP-dependent enzyme